MALSPKLDIRQSQSLVMTPQLMQSIKLLQMTHIELDQFLDMEIEKNPLLDRIEADSDDLAGGEPASGADDPTESADNDDWFQTEGRAPPKTFPPLSIIPWKTFFLMIWAPAKSNGNCLRARGRFPATAMISIR
ncbi:RNA polymerase factor sigma-54 [Brucella abortus]|nr:RNA polymerase factor sigma-54 [Brucella abortus]